MGALLITATLLPRAEEAWQPVIFGALIPAAGAAAVFFLIWYAVRQPPEEDSGKEDES